jgi:membrane fusion protein (multidrug efflux system)
VASELRDSQIRVELRLDAPASNIPLQHALPGTVELEVERISPAALILRAAGRRIS